MDTAGYITPTRSLRHTEKIRHYGLLFPSLPKIHLNHRFYALTGGVNYCSLNLHATDRTMPRPRSGQPQIQLHIIRHRTRRRQTAYFSRPHAPVKHTPAFITLKKGGLRWHEPKRPWSYGISLRSGQKTSVAHLINEAGHTFLSGFYRSLPINIPGWRDTS